MMGEGRDKKGSEPERADHFNVGILDKTFWSWEPWGEPEGWLWFEFSGMAQGLWKKAKVVHFAWNIVE